MRALVIACAALVGLSGCAEEKPAAQNPIIAPQDSGTVQPPEVKKGGRIPVAPK
jgi:hypothetical protein